MKTKDIIEGLQILEKYRDGTEYNTGAEHDVIHAYPTPRPLSSEDLSRMIELGWFQPDVDYADDDQFSVDDYVPSEGWACYA